MSFSSPWLLWSLFAVALPIIIHLINRWRHKSVSWAAMDFLLKAAREARGRKKLIHYLILALRCLAVACLILAAARPLLSKFIGVGGSGVDEIVLIFDRSPSMETRDALHQSLREKVIPLIQKTVKELGVERVVLIDSATGVPTQIESIDALGDLSQVQASDVMAQIPELLNTAAEYLRESTGKAEVWIASDMQASNWQSGSMCWEAARATLQSLPRSPHVRVLALRDRPAINTSIRVVDTKLDDGGVTIAMEIMRTGFPEQAQEQLSFNLSIGNVNTQVNCYVGNGVNLVHRHIPLADGKVAGFGYVALPKDEIPSDDQFFFTFSPTGVAEAAVFTDDNELSKLLSLMAAPPGIDERKASIFNTVRTEKVQLRSRALLVWQGDLPQAESAKMLESFIEAGGTVFFLPPTKKDPKASAFLGVSWGEAEHAPADKFFIVSQWDHKLGPLRDALDERAMPVAHLRAIIRQGIEGNLNALAQWEDQSVAIGRKTLGRGQAVFLNTLPYYTWSNLADGNFLLPLLLRLADDGAKRFTSPMCYDVGDAQVPSVEGSRPKRRDDVSHAQNANPEVTAGIYQIGTEVYAASRARGEDDPSMVEEVELRGLFSGLSMSSFSNQGDTGSLVFDAWKLFLGLALLCLLLEALLSMPPPPKKIKVQGLNVEI